MTNFYRRLNSIMLANIVLICVQQEGATKQLTIDDNEWCASRPTLVALDEPAHRLLPFYVMLYRCGGSAGLTSPRLTSCEPKTTQDVKIRAHDLHKSLETVIVRKNHTSCKTVCREKREMCDPKLQKWEPGYCRCVCKYRNKPPKPCPAQFKWNAEACSCECDDESHSSQCLHTRKVWSHDKCGCECRSWEVKRCRSKGRVMDEATCRCVKRRLAVGRQTGQGNHSGISKPLLFGVVVGEFFLLLIIFDLILFMKKWGLIYCLKKTISKATTRDKTSSPVNASTKQDHTTHL